jgi:hypothetical protein
MAVPPDFSEFSRRRLGCSCTQVDWCYSCVLPLCGGAGDPPVWAAVWQRWSKGALAVNMIMSFCLGITHMIYVSRMKGLTIVEVATSKKE